MSVMDTIQVASSIRLRALSLLEANAGDRILDVGCGTGTDVLLLAELVQPYGQAIGVERSKSLIMKARSRVDKIKLPVEFCVGDAHDLCFGANTFDGCWVNRTLVHVMNPHRAVGELHRVLRPGGRLVAIEPDWGTMTLVGGDPILTACIIQLRTSCFSNGRIGYDLPGLFEKVGLTNITIDARTITTTRFDLADQLWGIRRTLVQAQALGAMSPIAALRWLDQIKRSDHEGRFSAALTVFIVSGRK